MILHLRPLLLFNLEKFQLTIHGVHDGGDGDGNDSDCDDDGDSWMEGPLGGRGVMRWNLKSPPNEVTAVTNHPRRMSFDDKMMIRGY